MDSDIKALKARDLLLIPELREANLLAGGQGLEHNISRANVMEVPDIIDWVRPGEFLMTTGYPFREQPEVLAELIPRLAHKGVAAFGIKTKRFIDEVPAVVVEAANRHGLPLIELPIDTTFSDVVRAVMERVLVKEGRQLSIVQNRVQQIAQVLLYGGGILQFVRHLEQVVGNPVLLLDSQNQITMSHGTEELAELPGSNINWQRLREDIQLGLTSIEIGEREIKVHISVVPAPDRQQIPSLLLLLESRQEYGLIDSLTMDRAGELVAFEIINEKTRREIESKYIDQFLQDWLAGRMLTAGDLRLRAEACGCSYSEGDMYRVGIIRFIKECPPLRELQFLVKHLTTGRAGWFQCTLLEEELVVLLSSKDRKSMKERETELLLLLKPALLNREYILCFGDAVTDARGVPQSYQQGKRTFEIGRLGWKGAKAASNSERGALFYEDLGVYLLLYLLPVCEEVEAFKRKFLYPLQEYDKHHQSVLIDTLNAYYNHGGNMRAAAERLFTHYNTVAYRLDRVEELLGISMDEPEVRLQRQLALKLADFNSGKSL